MKTLLIIICLVVSFSALADCNYSVKKDDVKVKWTAFKTPKKLGVSGEFSSLGIDAKKESSSLQKLLTGTKFSINPSSVSSGNKDRDIKIAKFFFGKMQGKTIQGSIKNMDKGILNLNLTMNKVTKTIPLTYKMTDSDFTAEGHIDVFDFSMNKSLKGINQACKELHEGKTWSDIAISLSFKFTKKCS